MHQKYIDALLLMDASIAAKSAVEPPEGWKAKMNDAGQLHPANPAWDTLFNFILANFRARVTAKTSEQYSEDMLQIKSVLLSNTEDRIRSIPPVIAEVAWPLAVAGFVLYDIRDFMQADYLTSFTEYHRRYGDIILTS